MPGGAGLRLEGFFGGAGFWETVTICGYYYPIIITNQQQAKPQSTPRSQRSHKDQLGDPCGDTGSRAPSAHRRVSGLALVAAADWAGAFEAALAG
ncbi:MAG: hypothetical protein PHS80_02985 [Methanothrix sp.]|nr:hypothetical protein [Methanothrix sp.]MDD4447008.1 hypothetical protein [Methanothrix sp.]